MKKLKFGYDDILIIAGAALFTGGVWQIYPPAAAMVAGAALVYFGMAAGHGR
jgi:hypothetical protein